MGKQIFSFGLPGLHRRDAVRDRWNIDAKIDAPPKLDKQQPLERQIDNPTRQFWDGWTHVLGELGMWP